MKSYLLFILKYVTIGLAAGFLYLMISDKFFAEDPPVEQPQLLFSYAPAVNKISPSVVSIYTQSNQRVPANSPGISPRAPYLTRSYLGSGVIVTDQGHIVTNKHVIDDATRVVVYLWDNQTFDASFVGQDPLTDLAVIKINAANVTAAEFADSDRVNTGDVVLAVGNPFGLNQSASLGIVSATGRQGLTENPLSTEKQLENFIQTDAAINQGNSGGPLINPLGQVVGISTASYGQYGAEGINFATPSNTAVQVINQLIQHGQVLRGWLGIQFINPYGHAVYGIPKPAIGIMVSNVLPNSAAEQAGIKSKDVVTHLGNRVINSFDQYRQALFSYTVGELVTVKGYNDEGSFEKTMTIEPRPNQEDNP
ncbi:S1C family serine protease [Marinicella meishanensis]|uniref:S1C family serine protease n=1 Tax=Marinicella meishanensis TaxID=2873263 RepID=UPI001CC0F6CF|nr:trypsin-like peptidase domain-containing protein [Marinicella sp. NBU2979]